jgi:hypothetical protein
LQGSGVIPACRFNQCRKQDMAWKDNDFDTGDWPVTLKEVADGAGPQRDAR